MNITIDSAGLLAPSRFAHQQTLVTQTGYLDYRSDGHEDNQDAHEVLETPSMTIMTWKSSTVSPLTMTPSTVTPFTVTPIIPSATSAEKKTAWNEVLSSSGESQPAVHKVCPQAGTSFDTIPLFSNGASASATPPVKTPVLLTPGDPVLETHDIVRTPELGTTPSRHSPGQHPKRGDLGQFLQSTGVPPDTPGRRLAQRLVRRQTAGDETARIAIENMTDLVLYIATCRGDSDGDPAVTAGIEEFRLCDKFMQERFVDRADFDKYQGDTLIG